jgi:hypothetical protein
MNTTQDHESGCASDNVCLYADDELLYAAMQQPNGAKGTAGRFGSVSALAPDLGAILREYACGRNGSANGVAMEPLQRRFEIIAQTNPGAKAVRFNGRLLTYGELDAQADELALHLQRDGLLPGSFCALRLEPSLAQVRAILAVLKAGAACLQFDPALPRERLPAVLEVFRPSVLFVRDSGCAMPGSSTMRTIRCDEDATHLPHGWPDEFPVGAGTPAHAFATVFDSGGLCMSVRTHQALGACLHPICRVLAPVAVAGDPANFWRPLSEGALLTIAPCE